MAKQVRSREHPAPTPTETGPRRGRIALLAVVLAVATFSIYAQVRGHFFVEYDTGEYLTRNGWVQRGLTAESVRWALDSFHAANWHPLTWWSHMLDVELFGLGPDAHGAHLLHNVLLHVVNTVLLFLLFVRWTGTTWRSAIVAGLFGLHPMHVESVAWVVERKDVLSVLFGFLFLHVWTSWTRAPSLAKYALAWVLLALGLAAKSMVITLPCALFLLDVWPLARTGAPLRRRILEKLPFLPLIVASAMVTSAAQSAWGAMSSVTHIGVEQRVANALWAWPNYVVKLVWPSDLIAFYPWRDLTVDGTGAIAGWAAAFLAVCVAAFVLRKRAPVLFSGWFWFVGTLVPVIGLVQVGDQAMADRYSYLPSVGLFSVLVFGGTALLARARLAPELAGALGVLVVAVAGWLGARQIGYWKDTETLALRGIELDPENYKFRGMYGQVLSERARMTADRAEAQRLNAAALAEFERALAVQPNSVIDLDRAGFVHMRLGRNQEAEPYFRRALELAPKNSQVLNHLGGMYVALGNHFEAEKWLRQAVEVDERNEQAFNNLGFALERQGKLVEAETMTRRALEILPNYSRALLRLAVQLRKMQRVEEAAEELRKAGLAGISAFDQPEFDAEAKRLEAEMGKKP